MNRAVHYDRCHISGIYPSTTFYIAYSETPLSVSPASPSLDIAHEISIASVPFAVDSDTLPSSPMNLFSYSETNFALRCVS